MSPRLISLALCALFAFPLPLTLAATVASASSTASTLGATSARTPKATVTIINLNTADAATLAREMDGIGEAKARAIVEHRQRNGGFRSVDELALVKGIGAKTIDNNRARLTVAGAPAAKAGSRAPAVARPSPSSKGQTTKSETTR